MIIIKNDLEWSNFLYNCINHRLINFANHLYNVTLINILIMKFTVYSKFFTIIFVNVLRIIFAISFCHRNSKIELIALVEFLKIFHESIQDIVIARKKFKRFLWSYTFCLLAFTFTMQIERIRYT